MQHLIFSIPAIWVVSIVMPFTLACGASLSAASAEQQGTVGVSSIAHSDISVTVSAKPSYHYESQRQQLNLGSPTKIIVNYDTNIEVSRLMPSSTSQYRDSLAKSTVRISFQDRAITLGSLPIAQDSIVMVFPR